MKLKYEYAHLYDLRDFFLTLTCIDLRDFQYNY